ncbi:MAG: hypothetical protein ACJ8LG_16680 [Massilia sp.]
MINQQVVFAAEFAAIGWISASMLAAQRARDKQADAYAKAQMEWDAERPLLLAKLAKLGVSLEGTKETAEKTKQRAGRRIPPKK